MSIEDFLVMASSGFSYTSCLSNYPLVMICLVSERQERAVSGSHAG